MLLWFTTSPSPTMVQRTPARFPLSSPACQRVTASQTGQDNGNRAGDVWTIVGDGDVVNQSSIDSLLVKSGGRASEVATGGHGRGEICGGCDMARDGCSCRAAGFRSGDVHGVDNGRTDGAEGCGHGVNS